MKSVATPPRRGFTLVELLMVITIIGMLMALLVAGAMKAVNTAKTARVTVEVGMLDTAVQNYKNDIGGSYPPDCSFLGTTQAFVDSRNNRVLSHLRKAFPRFFVNGYSGLQTAVQKAFTDYNASGPTAPYPATPPNGTSVWGDLNNLDAAEALVFWLGGLPDVPAKDATSQLWSYRLKGFSANKLQPFNLTDTSRLKGPFEFQEQRLGDADGDGWPEYYPAVDSVPQPSGSGSTSPGNPTAPYAYFDGATYSTVTLSFGSYPMSGLYPPTGGGSIPTLPTNSYAAQWGQAIPYANNVTATQLTWMNTEKFQIISASIDSIYYTPTAGAPGAFRAFPSGYGYSPGDNDNVTNFSNGKLQDMMP